MARVIEVTGKDIEEAASTSDVEPSFGEHHALIDAQCVRRGKLAVIYEGIQVLLTLTIARVLLIFIT